MFTVNGPNARGFSESQITASEVEGLSPWAYLEIVRTNWWVTVLTVAVAVSLGAWHVSRQPDRFTATTLVQKRQQRSPLEALSDRSLSPVTPDIVASEVELLKSRSVLGPVVDSLALQVRAVGAGPGTHDLVRGARIDRAASPARYRVEFLPEGAILEDATTGERVAAARAGGVLSAGGLRLPVPPAGALDVDRTLELEVTRHEDAVQDISEGLVISATRNTSLLRIAYTATHPSVASDLVNSVALAYQAQSAKTAREQALRRREFLAAQISEVADSVASAQADLADYQETSLTLDPAAAGQTLAGTLRQEELELRQLRYQIGVMTSLEVALSDAGTGASSVEGLAALGQDLVPGGRWLVEELRELEAERSRLTASRYGYRDSSSRVVVVDSLIAGTRRQLSGVARESLELLRGRMAEIDERVAILQEEAGALPSQAAEVSRLVERADALRSRLYLLTERYHEAQIAEAVAASDVEVVDPAVPPTRPDPKSTVRPLVLMLLIGLSVGFLLSIGLELLNTTVRRSGDAEAATRLDLLGILPRVPQLEDGQPVRLVVGEDESATKPEAEAFHALQTTIRYAWSDPPAVMAVTSQGPREGKSFIAGNLAMSMAQQGARVLLIDADLRRPRQHRIHDVSRTPGLVDLLHKRIDAVTAIRNARERLWVVPAGSETHDPAQLMGGDLFKKFLERARDAFDTVILDTPPVLAAAELCSIAPLTDGVLVVARTNQTDRNALSHAVERLRRVRAPLLGVVLTGAPMGRGYRTYGGYYYRYYAYEEYLRTA